MLPLAYAGHTHKDLDGIFGCLTMYLLRTSFDDTAELIQVLERWLRLLPTGDSAVELSTASKMDEISDWKSWGWARVGTKIAGITGPQAPHTFLLVRRCDALEYLGQHGDAMQTIDEGPFPALPCADDVICIIKHYMRDEHLAALHRVLCHGASNMMEPSPKELVPRKDKTKQLQTTLVNVATKLAASGFISQRAKNYLVSWVSSAQSKMPRPTYPWLQHRWGTSAAAQRTPRNYDPIVAKSRMTVSIAPVVAHDSDHVPALLAGGSNTDDENHDDADTGSPLVIAVPVGGGP